MTSLNPAKLWRFISRNFRNYYRGVLAQILTKLDLISFLDKVVPEYLDKLSIHVEWEVDFLDLGPNLKKSKSKSKSHPENFYLNRKKYFFDNSSQFPNPFASNIAIVLQGPVVSKNHITLRILNFYKARYPEVRIIMSTWRDTNHEVMTPFYRLAENGSIQLILNEEPESPGVFNVNRQIVTTRNGLTLAKESCEYAIKSRTDQVFTDSRFLNQLKILSELEGKNVNKEHRIVISSLNTFAFRLYGASDMFQFGKTKDLFSYWDQPLDNRPIEESMKISMNLETEARKRVAEVYLNTNYFIEKYKKNPIFTFEESLNFLVNNFVVTDASSLGHRWLKSTNLSNRWRVSKFPNKFYQLTHTDWIGLEISIEDWMSYKDYVLSEDFYLES